MTTVVIPTVASRESKFALGLSSGKDSLAERTWHHMTLITELPFELSDLLFPLRSIFILQPFLLPHPLLCLSFSHFLFRFQHPLFPRTPLHSSPLLAPTLPPTLLPSSLKDTFILRVKFLSICASQTYVFFHQVNVFAVCRLNEPCLKSLASRV